jgi:hypothetical protein
MKVITYNEKAEAKIIISWGADSSLQVMTALTISPESLAEPEVK